MNNSCIIYCVQAFMYLIFLHLTLFSETDPWKEDYPPDLNYFLQIEEGVVQVYRTKEDVEDGRRLDYPFPPLSTFITDMNLICAMITDGPL